ncbi:hypothetical protein PARPLA_01733 [Rhodobacteraceae bacterium THAF1]|uniref:retropepsin-like aspartic protease family protein n=1 Tax=Palleronia sp. THAF1 TaxID=2587842 RepID=UPI000F4109D6|nr:TIGR02281 family clan AA aspartic protease [Palleronia sp. THAF1]QFU09132.1 hypothetical protein FIU81_10640 [Palleronia sp. THAF1]VDC24060.1 hypothetical protein PARPLA_01733 [Rhodobacteraceae bacterium THAF1]
MTGDDIGNFLYLALLGAAIFGYFIAANRQSMGRTLRYLALWGLIFVGVIAAAGLWPTVRDQIAPQQVLTASGALEVPLGPDGHYHMTLGINGAPIRFVVDTGATDLVLSQDDARRAGIEPDTLAYLGRAQTANGTVPMAQVRLETVTLGETVERNVPASVNGGEMFGSLLGMSYLSRFGRISIENNRLTLER